jgi:hypothetical protein
MEARRRREHAGVVMEGMKAWGQAGYLELELEKGGLPAFFSQSGLVRQRLCIQNHCWG